MKFVCVDRINNPKSENNGMWYVAVSDSCNKRLECVFVDKSKKACMIYAKDLNERPIVSNGIEYGAKF